MYEGVPHFEIQGLILKIIVCICVPEDFCGPEFRVLTTIA
jgi:hypothetical protein